MPIVASGHRQRQLPTQIVDVANWERDEDHPVFPVGSKPKELLICPDGVDYPFLISRHRYLFKTARGWQSQQTWSEILAYELARPIGIDTPACFLAVNSERDEVGVICEFFYGYPDDPAPPRLIHASDILQRSREDYDQKRGRPHSVRSNGLICSAVKIQKPWIWWARTLAFDALIGNTDRHPENWGFLVKRMPGAATSLSMAPVFDNGTSLGYEIADDRFGTRGQPDALSAYIQKGRHHAAWDKASPQGDAHFALCQRIMELGPGTIAAMKNVILLSDDQIETVTAWCASFNARLRFTEQRAEFVGALVKERRNVLRRLLGD